MKTKLIIILKKEVADNQTAIDLLNLVKVKLADRPDIKLSGRIATELEEDD